MEVKFPKLVCAVAWACPVEPAAVDFAWAALPLIVVAKELAFAAPAIPGNEAEAPPMPPVAVAVAFALPPSMAVEVAVDVALPPLPPCPAARGSTVPPAPPYAVLTALASPAPPLAVAVD